MFKTLWKMLGRPALCGGALLTVANLLQAQGTVTIPPAPPSLAPPIFTTEKTPAFAPAPFTPAAAPLSSIAEYKARMERLEKQVEEMANLLKSRPAPTPTVAETPPTGLTANDVHSIITGYIADKEAQQKATGMKAGDAGPHSYVVGKNMALSGVWTTSPGGGGYQPWFETPDKAYRIHFGGRFHPDWVFGDGSTKGVADGKGGTGAFKESFDLRRARLEADGWIGEVIDFMIEFDFVQQFSTGAPFTSTAPGTNAKASANSVANTINPVSPTDVYASINYIPMLGGVRLGNFKFPLGLDHLTSSRFLDFMERSSGFDIYYNRANGFEPGFMIFNNTQDERLSWQIAATKPDNSLFDISSGGGQWRYGARVTGLPYYEDNGRYMMHVGVGACYIDHLDQGFSNQVGRWLLRNGGNNLQNIVGLAQVFGQSQTIINPEFFMNIGPLSIQAEYIASQVNGVTSFNNQLTGGTPQKISERNYFSQTAYIQAMYFLTGESRPYGKTAVHGSGAAPTRVVPYRNYFWVPGSGSGNPFSAGAWQVGLRYSYADLSNNGINGGIVNELTFGLNWFLNPNMKIQWNYDIGHRELAGGSSDGNFYGFGMRLAFDF